MQSLLNAIRVPVFIALLFLFAACADTEADYDVGDQVEVLAGGTWYPSEVLEVKNGSYKVRHVNDDGSQDNWVEEENIRFAEENVIPNDARPENVNKEKMETQNGALPKIKGTSWSLLCIYEKGTTPKYMHTFPEYLFCNNGRWELHALSNSIGQMGTYTIDGNQLITVHDGADRLTGKYTITWHAAENYLELDDGKLVFRLRYRTEAKC
ncbi:MAG: hypothetical protein IPI54_09105 [Chitinophagaceae bacterium]|nr:hypothetical protein [Chitinophagaceae bacterium]